MSDVGLEKRPLSAGAAVVRNPLSVIAMFVLLVEAIATFTLIEISDKPISLPLVWFVVLFPTLIAILFFCTIWWRHQHLYSPMEFRSDEAFLTAMDRLKRVEARQEAAELNPRTADETQSIQVVDRLLGLGDVKTAVQVGRTFLEVGQHDIAARVFTHILEKTPTQHEDRYRALANLGYAQIGLGRHEDAVESLSKCIELIGNPHPWHLLALAYAHYRLSTDPSDDHHGKFEELLKAAKKHRWFAESRDFYKTLYPDIANYL
jgi:tetratricopeptide (TPR) repeat protein